MFLRDFTRPTKIIIEGGNLELANPADANAPYKADEINLQVHQRSYIVPILDKLLHDINNAFKAQYKTPLWSEQLLSSKQFLGGSSLHFFDTKISDKEFTRLKPKVGDIDTQCNKEMEDEVKAFLTANNHKVIGDSMLLGFSAGNEQYNALFQFQDPPMKIQIDFEFGRYAPETNTPDEWFRFSHSSDWADIQAGVKGVFHKYLYRALSGTTSKQVYIAKLAGRGKARSIQISDEPEDMNTASFAVASKQGGGVSQKLVPYIDPTTNKPMIKNGLPVMQEVPSSEREYEQRLAQQFITFFGKPPEPEDTKKQWSFVGTLDLINKYIDQSKKPKILDDFLDICFEPGSQMITRDDPDRDAQTKFIAVDLMLEKLGLKAMRPKAVQMAKAYADEFNEVEAYKKAHPEKRQPRAALKKLKAAGQLREAEEAPAVKAQLRKGMPHLRDLKPADFLDLLDEIHDGNGNFKLQNIPLNVKIDGFGGRFGKNAEGKPFMGTSRTEPRYQAGFLKYHQEKGTTDTDVLSRAKSFDDLFVEMMNAVKMADSKLGPDFLVDKQVTCEVLFLPFATKTEEGKLKFVGIEYDELPKGVNLVLVPFRVVQASTGEEIPDEDQVIQTLTELGQNGSVMFMSNRLVQKDGLDVTEIINPLENIEELKSIVSGTAGKRDRASLELRKQVEEKLKPIQIALEKAIDEDPNIIGKDKLGQDYEGIVINSRLGPIKVTSEKQKDLMVKKKAAQAAARSDQGRDNTNKTAIVAIGSFVGHKGHEELFNYTINKAKEVGGDPYLFIGNAVGKDDPIPPDVKVQTWHKMYPQYAKNISTVVSGGSILQKIKHELINPLPGKPPRYDNVIIMVGEDQANMPIAGALMKAVNKFQGYEHVKVTLEATPRGTGMSFSKLRNILKDPNATEQQQLALWTQGFDEQKLGVDWIKHLMDITKKGMGIATKPVAERLSTALIRPRVKEATFKKSPYGRTAASQQRAKELLNPPKPPEPKKDEKDVAEVTGDKPFDKMMTTIKQGTSKQKTADRKEQQKQTQQRARDSFGNMFGGGNPADKLKIRERGVGEAFDNPYKAKWEKSEYGDQDALVNLPDGTNLSIMFSHEDNNEWQVEFHRNNSQEVTGEGDAQRIFATVLNAMQKFIKKQKPARLTFAASKVMDPTIYYEPDEPQPNPASRAKLYDRLVQRYAKAWGYRAFRADNGHAVIYELSRMKRPARQGDLVGGGAEESIEKETKDGGSIAIAKPGYSGEANYTAQPNWRTHNIGETKLVPIGEHWENEMSKAMLKLFERAIKK
jgi:hypothetical protein